jgi:heterodisulfide reductase subunit A-like polyferredoxin
VDLGKIKMEKKVVGSVMVVGGGVAGIKAALDLADSGYYVYVVETTPAIGGVMAQLDKTFPTTDCSMCILSPYLVETGRHPNIELVTYADVETVEGYPGNFKVKVMKKARSIDTDHCTGCRACVDNCPVSYVTEIHES